MSKYSDEEVIEALKKSGFDVYEITKRKIGFIHWLCDNPRHPFSLIATCDLNYAKVKCTPEFERMFEEYMGLHKIRVQENLKIKKEIDDIIKGVPNVE